jgi:ribosomal protein S18 acetylase RimI-like enzyme
VITTEAATGTEDLLAAASILSRAWVDEAPFVASHPGDLEWWYALAAPDPLSAHLRLWRRDGTLMAWSWVRHGQVHWEIHVPRGSSDEAGLLDAILEDAIAGSDEPLHAWTPEDDPATRTTLDRHGFQPEDVRLSQFQRRLTGEPRIAAMSLPDGYRLRHVNGPVDLVERIAIHRAAFPHATLGVEHYARLMALPHYRLEDDLVIEAPDGTLAAFAMAWWDPAARVGEFEPVGTHPDHRRRGLGRALLSYGLRRYRDLGAVAVQIYSHADNPASEGLYQAVGFRRRRHRRRYERPTGRDVRSMR